MACLAQRACTRACSGVRTAALSAALLVLKPVAGRVLGNTLFVLALPPAATTPITFLSRRLVLWREEVKTNEYVWALGSGAGPTIGYWRSMDGCGGCSGVEGMLFAPFGGSRDPGGFTQFIME